MCIVDIFYFYNVQLLSFLCFYQGNVGFITAKGTFILG
ncbi:MAG: hypothetical protein ACI9O3_000293 [Colwellia sp.]|jgi:hypothetical protein